MFNVYDIFEYLLRHAYANKRVSYGEIYQHFNVNRNKPLEVANFLRTLEDAERRIVQEVKDNDIVPIYTVILYKKADNLPSSGFYDVFMNRNRNEFLRIAGNNDSLAVSKDIELMKIFFDRGMEILMDDLNDRFSDEFSIKCFIDEVRMYRDIVESAEIGVDDDLDD